MQLLPGLCHVPCCSCVLWGWEWVPPQANIKAVLSPIPAPARTGPALHASAGRTKRTLYRAKLLAGKELAPAVAKQLSDAVGQASSACSQASRHVARAGGLRVLELINADHDRLRSVQGCIPRWLTVIQVWLWHGGKLQ